MGGQQRRKLRFLSRRRRDKVRKLHGQARGRRKEERYSPIVISVHVFVKSPKRRHLNNTNKESKCGDWFPSVKYVHLDIDSRG
jgi:hypothetical protein